ncbi:hypothetical protein ABFX02_01G061900 [Erythranthe guttata]
MGNCIETACKKIPENMKEEEEEEEEKSSGGNNTRIKIMLTKEELNWLMMELQNKEVKRIEDLLGEIELQRSRQKINVVVNWKPSLDSIVEIPEVHDGMDRS